MIRTIVVVDILTSSVFFFLKYFDGMLTNIYKVIFPTHMPFIYIIYFFCYFFVLVLF